LLRGPRNRSGNGRRILAGCGRLPMGRRSGRTPKSGDPAHGRRCMRTIHCCRCRDAWTAALQGWEAEDSTFFGHHACAGGEAGFFCAAGKSQRKHDEWRKGGSAGCTRRTKRSGLRGQVTIEVGCQVGGQRDLINPGRMGQATGQRLAGRGSF